MRARLTALVLFAALAGAGPSSAALLPREAGTDTTLGALRAARRAAVRAATLVAHAQGRAATLTLLVIPVDFADRRLPDAWDPGDVLAPALTGNPLAPPYGSGAPALPRTSLTAYFARASAGRGALDVVLAPLVRLPGTARDYSDRGLAGFTRTRRLAAEALAGARDAGAAFARLDNDGPDGFPGTSDDDGEVDGVLILHSEAGDENDPEAGLVQALQYYLAEPVADRGTLARLYAVASLRSEVGIWAHEAAHLLGLEDRYDPFLPVSGSEVAGRGGLGVFSLMAAGALAGGGREPALPDAYSAAQLGWRDVAIRRGLPGSAPATLAAPPEGPEVWRVWRHGAPGTEWYLLASHDPGAGAGPGLVILHVDESLPERAQSSSDPLQRHLRVRLVEADGDGSLAAGLDAGGPQDLFPGTTGRTDFAPPASDGYAGPSGVSLTGIALAGGGDVTLAVVDAATPAFALDFAFAPVRAGSDTLALRLVATELGPPTDDLMANVTAVAGTQWGAFAGGAPAVTVPLARDPVSRAWSPVAAPLWVRAGTGAGQRELTGFAVGLAGSPGFAQAESRDWLWARADDPLDFTAVWPGEWTVEDRSARPGTTWHRWTGAATVRADGGMVLACTGLAYIGAATWPAVTYGNEADVSLTSGPLPDGVGAVRLVHAIDGELARPGVAYDAGLVEFVLPDGTIAPAEPLGGYAGLVTPDAVCALHGRAAFAGEDPLDAGGRPVWRIDTFAVPRALAGPVRLRLRFASDGVYRGRGWLVAAVEGLPAAAEPFPADWFPDPASLAWSWNGPGLPQGFAVATSDDNGGSWTVAWSGPDLAIPLPAPAPGARRLARVVAHLPYGAVASRSTAVGGPRAAVAAPLLGWPFPNPSRHELRLAVELPAATAGRLRAFDLRGRLLREWPLAGGARLLVWDWRDGEGRRLPAGAYLLQLATADGAAATRRAVRLP